MIDVTGLPTPPNSPAAGTCVKRTTPEPGIVLLVLDPPHREMPVFDLPLLRDLDLALTEIERDPALKGLVVTGRDARTFAAGADLDAIASLTDPHDVERVVAIGQELFDRIARLSRQREGFTSVAAIGGAAPGGACEIALACDWIVLADHPGTRIGLPETQLGILPGWGGTTRLPQRIGLVAALPAILTGRLYSARDALRSGFVDRSCAPEDLVRIALGIASGRERPKRRKRGIARVLVDKTPLAELVASKARDEVMTRTRGRYPAPLRAIEIASKAGRRPDEESFAAERAAVRELAVGPVCKHLVGIFRLQEAAKKLDRSRDGVRARAPKHVGVIGAGVMGRAIAELSAERGAWTRLFDLSGAALDVALLEHRRAIEEKRKKRRLQPNEATAAIDRLDAARSFGGFGGCELVIEAVAERLDVKQKLFADLAREMAPDALLATNTSSLSVAAIAAGIPHPERVVGVHFFNPVAKMPLVEIVRGPATSDATVARAAAFALALGKTPVVVADVAGFLVNRLLGPYLDESVRLLESGVEPARLERALLDFGMPMGPLALLDEVGFDIATHAAKSLHAAYGARMEPSRTLDALVEAKRLGKKTGQGFYAHASGTKPALAHDLARFVRTDAPRASFATDEEIAERALLPMLAEAARALDEGVVASPSELDLATIFGMGFAPFRGGLLRWADALGAARVVEKLEAARAMPDVAARGPAAARFDVPEIVRKLAREGRGFHA